MLHTSRVRPMHESVVLLVLRFASHQSFRKCLCFRRDWYECLKVIWWSVNPETLGGWSNRSTQTRCRAGLWQLLRVSVVVRLSLTCRVALVLLIRSPQKTRREDSDHLVFLLSRSCDVYMVTCVFASFSYYYNGRALRALHSMRWIGRGNNEDQQMFLSSFQCNMYVHQRTRLNDARKGLKYLQWCFTMWMY